MFQVELIPRIETSGIGQGTIEQLDTQTAGLWKREASQSASWITKR